MSLKNCERIKRQICGELSLRRLSPSHDRWHLEHVLTFARQLHEIHGGDMEVLTTAALLHDLGRSDSDLHGRASVSKSVKEARKVLEIVDISPSKIEPVMLAIAEHDQPGVVPTTIEGKILKDADFLAGFGAWGILRIAMWAAETQRGIAQILDRLQARMPRRFAGLQFPESVSLAARELLFAELCLSRLMDPPRLEGEAPAGAYIALEGISGSGKDTQAQLLKGRLEAVGRTVVQVHEPTGKFQAARDNWGPQPLDPVIALFLVLADRYELMRDHVTPALAGGDTVVSVRSYVSSLVYQQQPLYDSAAVRFMHRFVPPLDLLILYDVDAQIAHARCHRRASLQNDPTIGAHEQLEALAAHRRRYLDVVWQLPTVSSVVIDASKSVTAVAEETWQVVTDRTL